MTAGPADGATAGTSPGPSSGRPSAPGRRILAQAGFETATLLRNGEQLLVAVVLPALALLGLAFSPYPSLGAGRRIDLAVPGVLALCVLSTAFTGQAIATGFDRRYGVLRLLGSTPLGRDGLLAGKACAVLVVEAVQLLLIGALGLGLGWEPAWRGIPAAVLTLLLGSWAFVALALLLAGTVRPEGVLAIANLVWVLLLGAGGIVLPPDRLPAGLGRVAELLPSGALGDGLRAALGQAHADVRAWLVLLGWAVVATALSSRLFRWGE